MKEQLFYVWIEGFSPRTGEKVMTIARNGNYEITTYMTRALRVKQSDIPEVKELLSVAGVSQWAIDGAFHKTTYCPKGCMFKSFILAPKGEDTIKARLEAMDAEDWEEITIRLECSRRGGGVEISLDTFGYKGERMTAYQNYLGGGMLGSIQNSDTLRRQTMFVEESIARELDLIGEALAKYFHNLTNPDQEEWEHASFESLQQRPVSAY